MTRRAAIVALAFVSAATSVAAFEITTEVVGFGMDVVAAPGDLTTVVWAQPDGLRAQRFDGGGTKVGPELLVSVPTGRVDAVSASRGSGGRSAVVWTEQPSFTFQIRLRLYDAAWSPESGAIEVGEESAPIGPAVAVDGGGASLVVWNAGGPTLATGDEAVMARRFDAAGSPLAPAFQVNTTAAANPQVDVACTGSGYVVAWWATGEVRVQRLDLSGAPVGGEILVASDRQDVSVAASGAGGFVVAASDVPGSIAAWRYDASGAPLGGAIPVTGALPYNLGPKVAADASGAFVVAWIGLPGTSPDEARIRGRRFDASGSALGGEFTVSGDRGMSTSAPAIAFLAPDGFFATWTRDPVHRATLEGRVWQPTLPVVGAVLKLSDPSDPTRRRLKLKLRDPLISSAPVLGLAPVADGLRVHVFNTQGTGDSICLQLPPSGWVTGPTASDPKLSYSDAAAANGPCAAAKVRSGAIRLSCRASALQPIDYSLDEATQGGVGVIVTSGGVAYCAEFGAIRTDAAGRFIAKAAPRPAVCPAPAVACP